MIKWYFCGTQRNHEPTHPDERMGIFVTEDDYRDAAMRDAHRQWVRETFNTSTVNWYRVELMAMEDDPTPAIREAAQAKRVVGRRIVEP